MPYLSFSQVSVGDVIRFGPQQRWGLVDKINPGATTHWELICVYGRGWGSRQTVTPDPNAVYVAKDPEDAKRDRRNALL